MLCLIVSCVQLFVTLCTVAHQAPRPWEFSRQEHWSGLPFPSLVGNKARMGGDGQMSAFEC